MARRQCAKTLVIIKKNYELHRLFPDRAAHPRRDRARGLRGAGASVGIPFTFDTQELEHGQPFASLDEAVQFFRIYSKDEAPGAVTPEAVLPRLQKTGDDAFPYYLPQIKRLGILTIKMEDLL